MRHRVWMDRRKPVDERVVHSVRFTGSYRANSAATDCGLSLSIEQTWLDDERQPNCILCVAATE